MTQADTIQLIDISKVLDTQLQQGLTLKPTKAEEFKHLEQVAIELSAKAYIGRIAYAGQTASGAYSVQFNVDNGSGYISSWPQWAFELAKTSLLHGKKVWVIANGDPFGTNLIQVLILA